MRAEDQGPRAQQERHSRIGALLSSLALGPWPLALAFLFLSGCTTLPLPGLPDKTADEPGLIAYAASLTRMEGTERRQALTVAQRNWRETANPRDRARMGLAYGQWGHDGHDPAAAARNLHGALAAGDADWRENEREFLETRAAQLVHLAERERELAATRREARRLRDDLTEAERKLRAITAIERNLDERNGRGK